MTSLAPVHRQRAQPASRHGGGRALRRALDRRPTISTATAMPTRSAARRRLGAGRLAGDAAAAANDDAGRCRTGRLRPQRGEQVFADLGCAACHVPALPLEQPRLRRSRPATTRPGRCAPARCESRRSTISALLDWARTLPRNDKGRLLVPLFGDLKRHVIADQQVAALGNELLAQRFVERDVFMTAELWGVGSTAPYGHRGDMTTLDEVIRAHGGEGRARARRLCRAAGRRARGADRVPEDAGDRNDPPHPRSPLPCCRGLLPLRAARPPRTTAARCRSPTSPRCTRKPQAAGIDHTYAGPWEFFVGGGGAAFDCNGDRLPDLLLAGGKDSGEALRQPEPDRRRPRTSTEKTLDAIRRRATSTRSPAPIRSTSTTTACTISCCCASARMSS